MKQYQAIESEFLSSQGLNLQAVFNLRQLPAELLSSCQATQNDLESFKQLIVFAHGGTTLWQALKSSAAHTSDPVDEFSIRTVKQYFNENHKNCHYKLLYPADCNLNLQKLGELAGWHHPSPFLVGINQDWGTWFAYRVVVLADTELQPSIRLQQKSPCLSCIDKPCITHCAAKAMTNETFELQKCVSYRKQATSKCKDKCISRITCPVGQVHRYSKEQINYHYSVSMKAIEKYF